MCLSMDTTIAKKYADLEWAINLNRFALNMIGLWPRDYENAYDRFLSNSRIIFSFFLLVFVGVIPSMQSIVKNWGNMLTIIDCLTISLGMFSTTIKLIIIRWKKADLTLALNMITNDWLKAKSEKEQRVMIKYARRARTILIVGYVFMILGFNFLITLPYFGISLRYIPHITDSAKILPFETYYFYDKDRSPYYELTFMTQTVLLIITVLCYTGVDNLLGLLVFHLCGQMENLRKRLIKMKQYKTFYDDLTFIVEDHIRLIEYFDIIKSIFTLLLLVLVLYFAILFCLIGFLTVIVFTKETKISMIRVIYLTSTTFNITGHMCLYCFVGEMLITQCESMYQGVYNYEWYTLEPQKARTLILIMIRASKPLYITAGNMFPMTLSMFCNLIKTSCGYISVLLASFLIFVGAVPSIHSLVKVWSDMLLMIDNLQFTLPLLTSIIKLVVIWWKKADLAAVINMIFEDWKKVKTDKELHVMIKRARSVRILTMIGYTCVFFGVGLLITLPCFGISVRYTTNVTDSDKSLPLQTHYFYDKNRSPYFECTYVAQIFMMFITALCYSGVDNLLGLFVFHLCGQMENLKEKLINIGQFNSFNDDLMFIVKDHVRIIKCFNIIERTFTLLLLGLLLYFSTLFCLYGFLIITVFTEGKEMSVFRAIYLVSTAISVGGHMCLFCAVGEILVTQCKGIHQAAYEYEWYNLMPKQAKICILIMIRANRPLYITAGKMFPMTMSMFCNLIKTSAGYMSVLLAMQS
ncbi:uncharacterized protein [Anoplolepis gracilipes]|uniref:uncharacterized protein n=1 Tax=Anoplolepis gracilipes TaxID=354296 RepID=UPI003BA00C5F